MDKKRFLRRTALLIGIALLVISLAACNLSASKGPTALETSQNAGDFPVPGETDLFQSLATETQIAAAQQAAAQPAMTATSTVLQPAATAVPAVVQPTAVPPVVIEPTQGALPTTYTLQKGEHPFCIARRFNVNQNELLSLNGLGLSSQLPVGYTLKIPQTGNPFITDRSLMDHPASYTVKAGDTIYTIACAFGDVSPDMIALANGLQSPYELTAGNTIQIP